MVPVQEGKPVLMERRAANLLDKLMEEIHGWRKITPVSGWRAQEEQQKIWDDSLAERGLAFTEEFVALPGHSEHQTGLAIDLGLTMPEIDFICPAFPYRGICQIFRTQAARFGFVERYPAGKEEVTGIGHEPWHFRYVGAPHAAIMAQNGLTLEEYTDFIRWYPYGERSYCYRQGGTELCVSFCKARPEGDTELELKGESPYAISGNNVDGFVITEWRSCNASQADLRGA